MNSNTEQNNNVNSTVPNNTVVTPVTNTVNSNVSINSVPVQENVEVLTPTVNTNTKIEVEEKVDNRSADSSNLNGERNKEFVLKQSGNEEYKAEKEKTQAAIDERIKKANENYKPNSKFKNFLLIMFFVLIIAFVIFLPDIHNFVSVWQSGGLNKTDTKITTGTLECNYSKSDDTLDYDYVASFSFTDSKMHSFTFETYIKGDAALDADKLDLFNTECGTLRKQVEGLDGIAVKCSTSSNTVTRIEEFQYGELDKELVTAAYTEAGGTYYEYEDGADIDSIEKNMKASGYKCERK